MHENWMLQNTEIFGVLELLGAEPGVVCSSARTSGCKCRPTEILPSFRAVAERKAKVELRAGSEARPSKVNACRSNGRTFFASWVSALA